MATTISISDENWKKLNILRETSGETYNDILTRILNNKYPDAVPGCECLLCNNQQNTNIEVDHS